jgi:hypothetical protein
MSAIKLKQSTGPVGERAVAKFEAAIGARLPMEYRSFIESTNGGAPDITNSYILFPPEDHPEGMKGMGIDYFYNLVNRQTPVLELTDEFETFRGRIPDETISIGKDGMGNLLLLQVAGDAIGCMYCWDHESEGCFPDDPWAGTYFLAPSFREFCERLVRSPYED